MKRRPIHPPLDQKLAKSRNVGWLPDYHGVPLDGMLWGIVEIIVSRPYRLLTSGGA